MSLPKSMEAPVIAAWLHGIESRWAWQGEVSVGDAVRALVEAKVRETAELAHTQGWNDYREDAPNWGKAGVEKVIARVLGGDGGEGKR